MNSFGLDSAGYNPFSPGWPCRKKNMFSQASKILVFRLQDALKKQTNSHTNKYQKKMETGKNLKKKTNHQRTR